MQVNKKVKTDIIAENKNKSAKVIKNLTIQFISRSFILSMRFQYFAEI